MVSIYAVSRNSILHFVPTNVSCYILAKKLNYLLLLLPFFFFSFLEDCVYNTLS